MSKRLILLLFCLCSISWAWADTDPRLNVVTLNEVDAQISFSNDGEYEWEWDATNSRLRSTNYHVDSSSSETTITIVSDKAYYLSYSTRVSSEWQIDVLYVNGNYVYSSYYVESQYIPAGTYTIKLNYKKDSEDNSEDDRAYFSDLKLESAVYVEGQCGDNVNYVVNKNNTSKMIISGSGEMYDNPTFSDDLKTSIKTIQVNSGVESVRFSDFSVLTSASLPSGLKKINDFGFSGCTKLSKLTIPSSVTTIGRNAFYNSAITSIVIPASVTILNRDLFRDCTSLTSATIEGDITEFGTTSIFTGCTNLKSVTFIGDIPYLPGYFFTDCSSLESLNIPESATSIGDKAFYGCSSLAFVTLGNSIQTIGTSAFEGCTALKAIAIPNTTTSIGARAFFGCSTLTSLSLGSSLESIGDNAFYQCSSISPSLVIPNSVKTISQYAFWGCDGLTSITIGNSVESIGTLAFAWSNETKLTDVYCYATTLPTASSNAFGNDESYSPTLHIPYSTSAIYKDASPWNKFTNIVEIKTPDITIETPTDEEYTSIIETDGNVTSDDAKAAINEAIDNNSVTDFEDTGIDDATSGVEAEAKYVNIAIKNATVEDSGNGVVVTSMTFDVKPMAVDNNGDASVIDNTNITSDITFRLPVDSNTEETVVDMYHTADGANMTDYLGSYTIQGDATNGKYIEVSSQSFSTFKYVVGNESLSGYNVVVENSDATKIVADPESGETVDLTAVGVKNVTVSTQVDNVNVNFTRNFSNYAWQALYVPFDITLTDDILSKFSFAELWDTEMVDGETTIEFVTLKSGDVVKANTPYIFKIKNGIETGAQMLSVTGTTLYPTVSNSIDCSTFKQKFTFTGIYENTNILSNHAYYLSGGSLNYTSNSSWELTPYYFYMNIQNRSDDSYVYGESNAAKVNIYVDGDEEETTSIGMMDDKSTNEYKIYTVEGIKVSGKDNLSNGVYIINNKKYLIK